MSWEKIWLVLRREYLYNFKRPSFLFTAFGVPLLTLVAMFLIFTFTADRETNLDNWQRRLHRPRRAIDPALAVENDHLPAGDRSALDTPAADAPDDERAPISTRWKPLPRNRSPPITSTPTLWSMNTTP